MQISIQASGVFLTDAARIGTKQERAADRAIGHARVTVDADAKEER